MHTLTMAPVSQIEDGQIQNPAATSPSAAAAAAAAVASAAFAAVYSGQQQSDACATAIARPTASSTSTSMIGNKPPTVLEQACGISVRPTPSPVMLLPPSGGDAASTSSTSSSSMSMSRSASEYSTSTTTAESGAPSSPPGPGPSSLVSCLTNSTLRLSLNGDGVLVDGKNRTGYIAENLQFQFDGPPQSGAIYTAGWSVCPVDADADAGDGGQGQGQGQMTLALGGSTTFYQCLSGSFYNLYTENWAAQCSPVQLRVVRLVDC